MNYARAALAAILAIFLSTSLVGAQTDAPGKRAVRSAADLPRFSYPVEGTATGLLRADPPVFAAFARLVRRDLEATLAQYEIADHATLRGLLGTVMELQVLARNEDDAARATLAKIRELEDKPDAKLLSGLRTEAVLDARKQSGATSGDAYAAAFAQSYRAKLAQLPWAVVGTALKETKSGLSLLSASFVEGRVQASVEPAVERTHALGNDLAARLVDARYALEISVPLKAPALAAVSELVAQNNVVKPDIWAQREVTLAPSRSLVPVRIGIWDSGTDVALFRGQLFTDGHPARYDLHGLSYDLRNVLTHGPLFPLSAEQQRMYPEVRQYLKGFSDLQLAIDSSQADAVRSKIASLKPNEVPAFIEQLSLFGNYVHGTHVSGIAVRGNPAARIVVARITFDYKNVPLPPTDELEQRGVEAYKATVAYFRSHGVRVVNMSWGGTARGIESALEKNGIGADADERKRLAEHYFAIDRKGLEEAIRSAPEILFVCSAGNSNSNSTFNDQIPASLKIPNLMTVGAVDQAGDETSFTSYGPTVRVNANGYQVESWFPGGAKVRLSGTSMSAPNVVNLAAKLLALDPALRPAGTIRMIEAGSTLSADKRRRLIDPKRTLALLRSRR